MTQLKGDAGAMRSAAAMMLLGPGVPFIYYGEEIGMTGDKPDENLRRPMRWDATAPNAGFTTGKPWEGMGTEARGVNVESERGEEGSLWNWYRRLIGVRGAHAALAHGGFAEVRTGNPGVYAFVRTGEEPVMVVVNLTGKNVSEYALEATGSTLKGTWSVREVLHEAGATRGSTTAAKPIAELGAHEAYVFVMTKPQPSSR
jgi:glycosidase